MYKVKDGASIDKPSLCKFGSGTAQSHAKGDAGVGEGAGGFRVRPSMNPW